MHLLPLSLAHTQQWVRGLQWCRLSRQHQSLQQPKYSIFFKFHKFWICPPCLGPWPPRGAEGLRWHHQMTQTFKFWNSQAKDKRFHSLLPVALFVIFSLLSPHISHHWRELHRFYYASNRFEQSLWSYRHFWALEFVSTKDTKKTSILHQKDKISSHLSVLLKATPLSPSSILYAVFTTYNTLSWHPIFPRIHAEEMSSNIK